MDDFAGEHEPLRAHTFRWEDPEPGRCAMQSMSGLHYLQAMASGQLPAAPIAAVMNMRIVEVEEGRIIFEAEPAEYHYNPIGTVHGGFAATLLDSALGCAIHSILPAGTGYTTLEIKVNYVRPLTNKVGKVSCEGSVIHAGGRIATAEARLTDAHDRLYAHGTTTCMIFRS